MKSEICLAVVIVFLVSLIPTSSQQSDHSWMPQGRFGKRTLEQPDGATLIQAMLSGKYYTGH